MSDNFKFKKQFGQNFLNDDNILNNIANSVDIKEEDLVIEIGPGAGALTNKLVKKTKKVVCFEIDTDLKQYLKKYEDDGVKVVYGDFLKQDVNEIIKGYKYNNLYIIANLPYYITTPIITKIIDDKIPVNKCVFMVQKEVADRFVAAKSTKEYNSLTIFLSYYFDISKMFNVSKNVFYPKPNVDSAVIMLTKRKEPFVSVKNEELFFKLVRDAFIFKRKTLKNNLKNYNLDKIYEVLKKYDLDLSVRAETLSIEIFAEICNSL